jgi:hypothetical protein
VNVSPVFAVQRAIVAILRDDATMATLLASVKGVPTAVPAVVDGPAEGQAYPYVAVGEQLSIPDNDMTSFGREVTATLHVWTKTRSMATGQAIADRITALLDHQVATVDARLIPLGHRCVRVEQEFDQALKDPDPEIRHHILRFRFVTQQLT